MVFMPPGSAKSTYASILFPAWYLGRNPDKHVLASSHTTELAERFGRRVRNIIAEPDYGKVFQTRLAADSQAAGRWATQQGGEYYAAGVGSAILGFRADLGLIDDPVAGREAADSEREREKIWEWYKSDFYTRLKPGAAIVLIMQRWREDDLAGRLLDEAEKGGEQWEVLRLPMEAEEGDALGREPGEPLWPEWFTSDMREQARRDPRNWLALYQQRPRAESGGELRRE
ncbi:MAG: terminase, partial [Rhodospirillales bacterium]|nr:terminase [Rhodospirillales bacterium]